MSAVCCSSAPLIQSEHPVQGIAAGMVLGRLQQLGLFPYTHCNDLRVRYRWSQDKAHHQG